jgi:hypothetical protein
MVERIMLLKLVQGRERTEVAFRALSALRGLPELLDVSVGLPADAASEKSWDVSLVFRFSNLRALERALESESYLAFAEGELASAAEVTKAWNFERLAVP